MVKKSRQNNLGFTLVEIIVSIVIFGLGLTSLIGIQSNYVESYLREENLSRAAMYGQYILAMLDIEAEPPDSGKRNGNLDTYLSNIGYFDEKVNRDSVGGLEDWKYELDIQSFDVLLAIDALKKVELIISWSEYDLDSYKLIYYMKTPPKTDV